MSYQIKGLINQPHDPRLKEHEAFILAELTPPDVEDALLLARCPYCHGLFAVDFSYFDQIDGSVVCPMCVSVVSLIDEDDLEEAHA